MSVPHEIDQHTLFLPVFHILKTLNLPISTADLEELIIDKLQLPESIYNLISNVKIDGKEQTELHFQMHWVKVKFTKLNYIEKLRGKWLLTEAARILTDDVLLNPIKKDHTRRGNRDYSQWAKKNPDKVREKHNRHYEKNKANKIAKNNDE